MNRFARFSTCENGSSYVNDVDHDHGILVAGTAGDLQYRVAKHATIHGTQILKAAARGSLSDVLNPSTEAMNESHTIFHVSIGTNTNFVF